MTRRCRSIPWQALSPALLLLVGTGCGSPWRKGPSRHDSSPAPVACLGRFVPGERVIRVTGAAGVVKELRVRRQDWVRRGQVLAVMLGRDSAAAALEQAERDVEVARSVLAQAKAGEKAGTLEAQRSLIASAQAALDDAQAEYDRNQGLFDEGVISQVELDRARLALAQARERSREARERYRSLAEIRPVDLAVLTRRLGAAEAARDRAAASLELTVVRAPMDGRVLDISAYPGETVGPAGILALGDTADMRVEAEVDVLDLPRVRIGGKVRIRGEGLPVEIAGRVEEIYGAVAANQILDPAPLANADLRVVKVRIRPEGAGNLPLLVNAQVLVTFLP